MQKIGIFQMVITLAIVKFANIRWPTRPRFFLFTWPGPSGSKGLLYYSDHLVFAHSKCLLVSCNFLTKIGQEDFYKY